MLSEKRNAQLAYTVKSESVNNSSKVLLLNIDFVPGREIDKTFGALVGYGDFWFGSTKMRVDSAREQAIDDILEQARLLGADAIIGLDISVSGIRGFWGLSLTGQSAVVQAVGTAIKLKAE